MPQCLLWEQSVQQVTRAKQARLMINGSALRIGYVLRMYLPKAVCVFRCSRLHFTLLALLWFPFFILSVGGKASCRYGSVW